MKLDFRSDTVTEPTKEMIEAMGAAEVGNSSWDEDVTVNELQKIAAELTGKEASLYVPSGTMANLLAAMTHAEEKRWGAEVILSAYSHSYWYEAGGISKIAGLSVRTIDTADGQLTADEVRKCIRPVSNYAPNSLLLWMENPCMIKGGTVSSVENMKDVYTVAKDVGLKVHLDGARIFNGALTLGVEAKEIAKWSDSVMFCLSKGLSCPVGSMLCGTKEFISKAKRNRIMLGGTMRQAGVTAAAGIVALNSMIDRLYVDHENAKILAEGFSKLMPGSVKNLERNSSMVLIDSSVMGMTGKEFSELLAEKGIKTLVIPGEMVRFVLHRHIGKQEIETTLEIVQEVINDCDKSI